VASFKNWYTKKNIQCIHTYLWNSLSVVMVNVFTSVWVERGLDSRFPWYSWNIAESGVKKQSLTHSLIQLQNKIMYSIPSSVSSQCCSYYCIYYFTLTNVDAMTDNKCNI
jgi:hypothetical protein